MKIKRYTAASMRAALGQVRAEQGPDAVILSSRRSEEGIEVIAAVDYDEALFAEANAAARADARSHAPTAPASPRRRPQLRRRRRRARRGCAPTLTRAAGARSCRSHGAAPAPQRRRPGAPRRCAARRRAATRGRTSATAPCSAN